MVDEQADKDNELPSLHPNGKVSIPENFEELEKTVLIELLKENKKQCVGYEQSRRHLEIQVEQLEKDLNEQFKKCRRLEDDKAFLRNNIKKASTNWFERKAKLSESDNEHGSSGEEAIDQDGNEESQQRNDRAHILITEEAVKLFSELKFKDEQLELSELRCNELNKRLTGYEKVIDDQEVVIHGLERQLNTYFNDNQKMSKQLADLNKLFGDLEKANEKQVKPPDPIDEEEENSTENIPSEKDFKDMSKSVSKTYTKLKELIYEKKSLVTEIERLKTLNVELQFRVTQQESRLINVSDAIQTTWLLVSNLKDEHAKLHTSETILRYELKEKREILRRLREELECSREQWHIIRQKNSETEQEWTILREEINARRKAEQFGEQSLTPEEVEEAVGGNRVVEKEFEPPIDLLVDMAIEYGIISADDEEPTTVVSLIGGEDVHADRLQSLEDQCCFLYQKLMSSTARALTLASRLTSIHQHYALSDEEGDDDDDEEGDMDDEEEDDNAYEVEAISPDSESYDTAYVSEVEGADAGSVTDGHLDLPSPSTNENATILENIENGANEESSEEIMDDNCDILSRRLITFLPKKIEILKLENKKLEERLTTLQEEKNKAETSLNAIIDIEKRQRRQLEQQLTHLGKCVDELKLERNGKIAEVEEELRRKVEEVRKEEEEFVQLKDQFESLQEKFEQREQLLQLSSSQLEVTEQRAGVAEDELRQMKKELQNLQEEIIKLKKIKEKSSMAQASQTEFIDTSLGVAERPKTPQQISNESSSKGDVKPDNLKPIPHISEAQAERLTIMTNAALRLPFQLDIGSSLCWTLGVHTDEITVSIVYEQQMNSGENKVDVPYNSRPSFQFVGSESATINPVIMNELVEPHKIPASNGLSKGTLTPRIPGRYSVILVNQTRQCQEISMKFWLQQTT